MLIGMQKGSSWPEVIEAIELATGQKKPRQTLQTRFPKVAAIMDAVKDVNYDKVLAVVAEVDAVIEKQVHELKSKRFTKVSELMKEKGFEDYPVWLHFSLFEERT